VRIVDLAGEVLGLPQAPGHLWPRWSGVLSGKVERFDESESSTAPGKAAAP
jgi:hypothetical protein